MIGRLVLVLLLGLSNNEARENEVGLCSAMGGMWRAAGSWDEP
jgi:hypothetical protein